MTSDSTNKTKTGLVYDDIYLKHDTGFGHPECADRLKAIMTRLEETGLLSKLKRIDPEPATKESLAAVHDPAYIDRVKQNCERGASYIDTLDCPICKDSYDAAVMAAGGAIKAVDAVMEGRIRNAFCAVRPPGHHALGNMAMGFCLFNNVAVAARHIQQGHPLKRVLIVDGDVHHGNGTQAIFYDDPNVLYYSSHRYPFYPGTGAAGENGTAQGRDSTINAPLAMGSCDNELIDALKSQLVPRLKNFRPDFILVSAGFDAHEQDPLGGLSATTEGYGKMTQILLKAAGEYCDGRLVSLLEGGYDLDALAASVEAHVRALMGL